MNTVLQSNRPRSRQRMSPELLKAALSTIAMNARIAVENCDQSGTDDADILQSLLLRIGVTTDHVLTGLGSSPVLGNAHAWMLGGAE